MESKVCARSEGQPAGPRNRAMMETARSNRSPVVGMEFNLNDTAAGQQIRGKILPLGSFYPASNGIMEGIFSFRPSLNGNHFDVVVLGGRVIAVAIALKCSP